MYRWLTRPAAALIALEVLAFMPCAGSAYADSAAPGFLDVYPRNGTSYSQQARDQYECDIAAAKQTGFDPTAEDGGVPPDVAVARRAEYLRAAAACLEARGYSVKLVNVQA